MLGTGILFQQGQLNAFTQTFAWSVIFFFASAGASAAYLTVSEVFPMETRAMAIRVLLRVRHRAWRDKRAGDLRRSDPERQALGAVRGVRHWRGADDRRRIVELWLGIEAAGRELEDIAAPLSAREAEEELGEEGDSFTFGRDQRIVRTTRAQHALQGRRVADVMVRDPATVNGEMSVREFIADVFLTHRHTAYPVTEGGHEIVGIVSVREVLELPRDQWEGLRVRDRMHPVASSLVIDSESPLGDALRDLARTDVHRALVPDHGHLHSLLSMTDVARVFEVLSGEDIGYLGGAPSGRYAAAAATPAGAATRTGPAAAASTTDRDKS